MSGPVRSVAVVGRDAALWIAAAGLKRALGGAGIEVQAVELPSLLQPHDVYAALPSVRGLHRILGLDEDIVIKACGAVPMVGQRFSNWSEAAPPLMQACENDLPSADLNFIQYWLTGRLEGRSTCRTSGSGRPRRFRAAYRLRARTAIHHFPRGLVSTSMPEPMPIC